MVRDPLAPRRRCRFATKLFAPRCRTITSDLGATRPSIAMTTSPSAAYRKKRSRGVDCDLEDSFDCEERCREAGADASDGGLCDRCQAGSCRHGEGRASAGSGSSSCGASATCTDGDERSERKVARVSTSLKVARIFVKKCVVVTGSVGDRIPLDALTDALQMELRKPPTHKIVSCVVLDCGLSWTVGRDGTLFATGARLCDAVNPDVVPPPQAITDGLLARFK